MNVSLVAHSPDAFLRQAHTALPLTSFNGNVIFDIPMSLRDRSPAPSQPAERRDSNRLLVNRLADSKMFHDFQRAFEDATRLPLTLRAVQSWQLAHAGSKYQNGFCQLMSKANQSCAGCLQMQQSVCERAGDAPATLSCVFGLNETAVNVKLGRKTIAYLQTGQVFFKPPGHRQTQLALKQIKSWGFPFDEKEIARRYRETPVVQRHEYEARVQLLQFFANQLGPLANQILLREQSAEPEQITRARKFIEDQHREKLTLSLVARQAGMSTFHFCKKFKQATGVHFTHYVSCVRVEEAKKLFLNSNYRVCEVAYGVGFQSLTHFNRAFRTIAGESPRQYRQRMSNI